MSPVALVTGGGSGIGRAVALVLSRAGYSVAVVGRRKEELLATVRAMGGGEPIAADLRCNDDLQRVSEVMGRRHDRLDVLVNNAGVADLRELGQTPLSAIDEQIEVNFSAVLKLTSQLTDLLVRAAPSLVVNIGSEQSLTPMAGRVTYGATKAALNYATRAMAAEYAGRGVRVNALLPGGIDTPMLHAAVPGGGAGTPIGGVLDPHEVAVWVLHLLDAHRVTGALISIDGGLSTWTR